MKISLDAEFTHLPTPEDPHPDLLSLALVTETGDEFYAEFTDHKACSDWVVQNVVPHMSYDAKETGVMLATEDAVNIVDDATVVMNCLKVWLTKYEDIELWAKCCWYDYSLTHPYLGRVIDYHKMYDFQTFLRIKKIDPAEYDIIKESGVRGPKHNSLVDARALMTCIKKHDL